MDKNAITLGLRIGRILAGQRRKRSTVAAYNLLDLPGRYESYWDHASVDNIVKEEFSVGGFSLVQTNIEDVPYSLYKSTTSDSLELDVPVIPAGSHVVVDFTLPTFEASTEENMTLEWYWCSFGERYVYGGSSRTFDIRWNASGDGAVTVTQDDAWERYSLTLKQDSTGKYTGFKVAGILAGEMNVFELHYVRWWENHDAFRLISTVRYSGYNDLMITVKE